MLWLVGALLLGATAAARGDELDTLSQAIDAQPDNAAAYDAYALAAFKAKRYDDAIRRLKSGVARISGYSEGYYKLAFAYRQKREWADAADYYRRYMQIYPAKTDPYFGLGASLQGLGDNKGALAAYEKYIELEKAPSKQRFVDQARLEVGRITSHASGGGATTPATSPSAPSASGGAGPAAGASSLRQSADALRKEGRLDDAAQAYRRAIEADRSNLELYNELGSTYFAQKKFSEAAAAFQEATARDPNYALGWYNLAHALRKADRRSEAAAAYRQYIRLRPDDPDPYYGLGQTLKGLGDVAGAISAFRRYIDMEKRPEEQRWVDKAKTELQALEAMPKGPSGRRSRGRGVPDTDGPSSPLHDTEQSTEPLHNPTATASANLYRLRYGELRNPFGDAAGVAWRGDLLDPFAIQVDEPSDDDIRSPDGRRRLRAYGAALAAYRRALSRQVEEIEARLEKGSQLVANGDQDRAVLKVWNGVAVADSDVESARRNLERVRATFARPDGP
jgi:tetratricopeptide (TPR) repeat protein